VRPFCCKRAEYLLPSLAYTPSLSPVPGLLWTDGLKDVEVFLQNRPRPAGGETNEKRKAVKRAYLALRPIRHVKSTSIDELTSTCTRLSPSLNSFSASLPERQGHHQGAGLAKRLALDGRPGRPRGRVDAFRRAPHGRGLRCWRCDERGARRRGSGGSRRLRAR
jgi:hypothetical protein